MKIIILVLATIALCMCEEFDITGQYEVRGFCSSKRCPVSTFKDGNSYFQCPQLGQKHVYISKVGDQYSLEMKTISGYVSGKYISTYFDDSNYGVDPDRGDKQIQIPMSNGYVFVLQPCYTSHSHRKCPRKHFIQNYMVGWKMRMGEPVPNCEFELFKKNK